jgi:hypothetical protein
MGHHRVRVGVARFHDGWNVVVEFDGKRNVYDPTYATEAEALAKADEAGPVIRRTFLDNGAVIR